jgi:hypothetical protein
MAYDQNIAWEGFGTVRGGTDMIVHHDESEHPASLSTGDDAADTLCHRRSARPVFAP